LSFLAFPLVQDYETNIRFQARLYNLAKERAREHAAKEEWTEAAKFVEVCEKIWPNGKDISGLKTDVEIKAEEERLASKANTEEKTDSASGSGSPQPVNIMEAMALARKALAEERYYDAHWLATLAGKLSRDGSVEQSEALRLAGQAWSRINSMAPNARETQAYSTYRLKRDGYEAVIAREWIRSYYIFRELMTVIPDDPDVSKYLAMSQDGLKKTAFFADEMDMATGQILTGAVFSLPMGPGRVVVRIASLSIFSDYAYCLGAEIMAFGRDGRPLWSMEAPYAKILPIDIDLRKEAGPSLVMILRALDRADKTRHWEPLARGLDQKPPDSAQIIIDVSWDNFLLLARIRRSLSGLSPAELIKAAEKLGTSGYMPQVFYANLLFRFAEPVFLLPLGIFAITLGWRYRARKRARYMAIPMLGILPLVLNGAVYFCKSWLNNLGIWTVLSFGFTTAAIFFGAGLLALLVISLIILAAQHS